MNHELLMIFFWLLWGSLVLGGAAAVLCSKQGRESLGLRRVRVPAPVRRPDRCPEGGLRGPTPGAGPFPPLPRLTTRRGPTIPPGA
jgi:hypothetical protein